TCRQTTSSREFCNGRDTAYTGIRSTRRTRSWNCGYGASGAIGNWSAPVVVASSKTAYDSNERSVRDLPWSALRTRVHIEVYRVKCPECAVKIEKVPLLPSKARFSQRFEDAVGQACEGAAARQVARRFGLAESTVRAIDLEQRKARRRQPALREMGVDEIHVGKKEKFLTVVCNLETAEPLWFGRERKKETLDAVFRDELSTRHGGVDSEL